MIYSNLQFIVLLLITLAAYAAAPTRKSRLWVLLAASAVFYGSSRWLDLLVFGAVTFVAWSSAILSTRFPKWRKHILAAGIAAIGAHLFAWKLEGAVPIGISFYSLQKIAYLSDLYRKPMALLGLPEFTLFSGFFAQLISGPITRTSQLVPQLRNLSAVHGEYVLRGTLLFVNGFFKKAFIGDNLGYYVDPIFARPNAYGSVMLIFGVVAFTAQLWADFSGYTDMGRGAALLFGIELPENFRSPFFARGPAEFWRRWHITFGEWVRDYLFIPLWMRFQSPVGGFFVILITMLLSGLWHGMGWSFALYGLYWGLLLCIEAYWRRTSTFRALERRWSGASAFLCAVVLMQVLALFSRLIFRTGSLEALGTYLGALQSNRGSEAPVGPLSFALALVALAYVHQVATYEPLDRSRPPVWLRICSFLKLDAVPARLSPAGAGLLGGASGILLAAIMVGSAVLWLCREGRGFIYFQF